MDRTATKRHFHQWKLALASAVVLGSLASPAIAAPKPGARLVRCGAQSCLRVTGHRDDPASIVRINGHAVPVAGQRSWKVYLPIDTVREWSVPFARTIEVSTHATDAQSETVASVDLPIGMLGQTTELASLVVSLR